MKKIFALSTLIAFAMICSCQKQDSTAEQELAQRKVELDAREEASAERKGALVEGEKALVEREKALAENEKATANARTIPTSVEGQTPDAAGIQAERDRRIQRLPPEFRALIPNRSQLQAGKAEKDRMMQERNVQRQRSLEDARRKKLSQALASPEANAPEAEATSPSLSLTPQ